MLPSRERTRTTIHEENEVGKTWKTNAIKAKDYSNEASGNTVPEVAVEDGVVVEGPLEPVLLVLNRPFPLLHSFAVKVLSSEAGLATELEVELRR